MVSFGYILVPFLLFRKGEFPWKRTKSGAVTFLQGLIKNATAEELMRVLRHIDFRVTLKPDYTATITVNPAYLISETSRVFVERQFWQTIGTRAANITLFAA